MEGGTSSGGLAPDSPFDPGSPLVPDSVLALPGGAVLVLERARGLPVAGIRISAPLDRPGSGAARVLLDQALARARPQAEAVGATVEAGVQDGRLYYQAVGDLRDIDELAWIARRMALPPDPDPAGAAAWERAGEERSAETPQGRLALAVQRRAGWDAGRPGARAVAAAGAARRLWLRSHARDQLRIFVLGDVPVPWVLADLSRIGTPAAGPGADGSGDASDPPTVGDLAGTNDSAAGEARPGGSAPRSRQGAAVYAWEAAAFQPGPAGDPAVMAVLGALRAGLRSVAVPGADLRLHDEPGGVSGWTAVTARARRGRDATAALDAALALLTEEGMDAWWLQGAAEARADLLKAASTPGGWLALADRYFVEPSPSVGARGAQERDAPTTDAGGARAGDAPPTPAWPLGALDRLESLHRSDLTPVVQQFRATLFRPSIGP